MAHTHIYHIGKRLIMILINRWLVAYCNLIQELDIRSYWVIEESSEKTSPVRGASASHLHPFQLLCPPICVHQSALRWFNMVNHSTSEGKRKPLAIKERLFCLWARRDLNPHSISYWFLRPACLPIPPLALLCEILQLNL